MITFAAVLIVFLTGFALARRQCSREVESMREIATVCLKEANDLRDEVDELKGENAALQSNIQRRF
jgi:hypothetical protein